MKKWVYLLCGIFVIGLLILLSFPIIGSAPPRQPAAANSMLAQFKYALSAYIAEYNELPSTSDNRELYRILIGDETYTEDNPRRIVFMEFNEKSISKDHEMLDPWSTPYRFQFLDDQAFTVISAGEDRKFGTKDDLTNGNRTTP